MTYHIPNIICEVCKRQVERTSVEYLQETDEYHFTVFCHGAVDRSVFPVYMIEEGWQITEAKAFRHTKPVTEKETIVDSVVVPSVPLLEYKGLPEVDATPEQIEWSETWALEAADSFSDH